MLGPGALTLGLLLSAACCSLPAALGTRVPAKSQLSTSSCDAALRAVCGEACQVADPQCTFACADCAGDHQPVMQAAGCGNDAAVAFCAGVSRPPKAEQTDEAVHTVHLVFSHHLDVGLNLGVNLVEFCAGFATTIIQVYFDKYIPLAMKLATEINSELESGKAGSGVADGHFAYTIHPWIASLYVDCVAWDIKDGCELNSGQLRCPSEAQVAAFDAAVRRGDLLWADSPMNLNSGVVGEPSMFAGMLDIAGALNERYNITKQARVWTNVDVPGFARSSIPQLKRGGATALNILANVGSHYPCSSCNGSVPTEFVGEKTAAMFRWHDPASDEEILVLYHKAQYDTPADVPLIDVGTTYGGFTRLDNMIVAPAGGIALASAVLADNTGPPGTTAEVQKIFELVRGVFPNATMVVGSTWDRFVEDISPAEVATLPRYSSEWGDKWVSGMVNDPGRLATYRALVRARADCVASGVCSLRDPVMRNFTRFVTKNSEHTQGVQGNGMQPGSQYCIWGAQAGVSCPANAWWKNDAFRANHNLELNSFPGADDSWIEDRLFSQLAIEAVPTAHPLTPFMRRELEALVPRPATELAPLVPIGDTGDGGRTVNCQGTILKFSTTGALDRLTFRGSDGSWSQLMDLRYLKYRPLDRKGVVCNESSCPNPIAGAHAPTLLGFRSEAEGSLSRGGLQSKCNVVLELGFNESLHREYGAPASVTAEYTIDPVQKRLNVSLTWRNKTATRMQESMTVFHRPFARTGHRWAMDKLGEWVSPANVTAGGEQYQHALWSGIRYTTSGEGASALRGLWFGTLDAAMACPVLNKVADKSLTPDSSLLKACFKQDIRNEDGQQQRVTDAMIDGLGINMYANLFTISGYPQWYPFGVIGSNYQAEDATTQFRFSIEER